MYKYFLMSSLLVFSLKAESVAIVMNSDELKAVDANKSVEVPLYYADFKWDVGIVGGLTFDGRQEDAKRNVLGLGLNIGYHITPGFTVQGEYVNYFKTFAEFKVNENIRFQNTALSLAYDFTPEHNFGLFVKAGVGYEKIGIYKEKQKHPISLIGLGFRFKIANYVSTYLQGRWRMRLSNISQPDNGLIATWGVDYHFGVSDEKSHLMKMADDHNKRLEITKK